MRANLYLFEAALFCTITLGIGASTDMGNAADTSSSINAGATAFSQLCVKTTTGSPDDTKTAIPSAQGAQLYCVNQRLRGEAKDDGLWIVSTASNAMNDRFRVVATKVCRTLSSPPAAGVSPLEAEALLPRTGTVTMEDRTVRFTRPGLLEEYTVSKDGVRQDFVVLKRPEGAGELVVELAVTGSKAEQAAFGTQLALEHSGRKIAYGRLRSTDATGKELNAHFEVLRNAGVLRAHVGVLTERLFGNQREEAVTPEPAKGDSWVHAGSHTEGMCDSKLTVVVNDADAVYPVRIDPTFSDANWTSMGGIGGVNSTVTATVVDASGNLYIGGGFFTIAGDAFATSIAKWDGSRWMALGSGLNGYVYALAVSGSNLYAAGDFTMADGTPATNVARWNGGKWSAVGSGLNNIVYSLAAVGSDVYAGGFFTAAGGSTASRIAKWNGSDWSALGSGMSAGISFTAVYTLAVSGSNLYAGGNFTVAGGVPAANVARWDGSSWSGMASGMDDRVTALAVLGGDLYAGGWFKRANGTTVNRIAKWDGISWSALGSGMNWRVYALVVSGGNLYAAGDFTIAGSSVANRIAKWDGSSWSALGTGVLTHG